MEDGSALFEELGPDVKKAAKYLLGLIHSAWERQEQWESSDGRGPIKGSKTVDVPIAPVNSWLRQNNYFDEDTLESTLWVLHRYSLLTPTGKDRQGYDVIFYKEGLRDYEGELKKETHFVVKVPGDFSEACDRFSEAISAYRSHGQNTVTKAVDLETIQQVSPSFDSRSGAILIINFLWRNFLASLVDLGGSYGADLQREATTVVGGCVFYTL